jgi:hypothetical protein
MALDQTKITGGKVTYGLTVCPKQYESKRADVELTFTVGPDDDYEEVFKRASQAVVNRVRVLVDLPELKGPTKAEVVALVKSKTGLFD